jgi:hypothetical protein
LSSEKKVRAALLFLCVSAFSCREIEPYNNPDVVQGYQVNGILTTDNGIPIDSASILLYYYYKYYSDQPFDTVQAVVTNPAQLVDISVYTTNYEFLKTLFSGPAGMTGPLSHYTWDGKDWHGYSMPSGKYLIRYKIDTTIVKYSVFVLQGQVSAMTDYGGKFTIPNKYLPVGEIFDIYYMNGEYYVTYQVEPRIALVFIRGDRRTDFFTLDLQKDKITTGAFTL